MTHDANDTGTALSLRDVPLALAEARLGPVVLGRRGDSEEDGNEEGIEFEHDVEELRSRL